MFQLEQVLPLQLNQKYYSDYVQQFPRLNLDHLTKQIHFSFHLLNEYVGQDSLCVNVTLHHEYKVDELYLLHPVT